jgi:hypothetical protein
MRVRAARDRPASRIFDLIQIRQWLGFEPTHFLFEPVELHA